MPLQRNQIDNPSPIPSSKASTNNLPPLSLRQIHHTPATIISLPPPHIITYQSKVENSRGTARRGENRAYARTEEITARADGGKIKEKRPRARPRLACISVCTCVSSRCILRARAANRFAHREPLMLRGIEPRVVRSRGREWPSVSVLRAGFFWNWEILSVREVGY